jgi:DNA-binding CsgD family transcriptional regulator
MASIVQSFLEAAVGAESWPSALSRLADLFGGIESHFTVWNWCQSRVAFSARAGRFPKEATESYSRYFCQLDFCREALIWSQAGELCLTQNYPDNFLCRTEIYNDFLRPLGARYVMGIKLLEAGSSISILRIHRSARNGPYTDQDARKLQHLLPSLARAARLHEERCRTASQSALAAAALDSLPIGAIVVDAQRFVLHANAVAQSILSAERDLTIRQGQLGLRHDVTDASLRRSIESICGGGELRFRPSGLAAMRVGNYELSATALFGTDAPLALITLTKVEEPFAGLAAKLRRTHGLTASEAVIAEEVVRGRNIRQIAYHKRITVNTVKTHLKAIFNKTAVQSQSDLVRLALGCQSLEE